MRPQDIQAGKTYYGRRGGVSYRTVVAILPFDPETMTGKVVGTPANTSELVVQYRTHASKPRIVYLWLTQFAYWAGAEVGRVKSQRQAVAASHVLKLTDEVQQDAGAVDGAVAYLVFTSGEVDYRVFTDQSEAVAVALDEAVKAGSGVKWRVYPLYAGPPITG